MRRILLTPLLTALVMAASVVPAAAFGTPPSTDRPAAGSAPATISPVREHLRMACAFVWGEDHRGVACKWSEAKHPKAAGYVLWRSVDGGPRERIYRTGLDGRRHFLDTDVKRGQTIHYAVIVVDKHGHRIGRGGPVEVRIPPVPTAQDALALGSAQHLGG